MAMPSEASRTEALVIGAGQAGLAAACALRAAGVACVVHERNPRIGDVWRRRFDSLELFTSRNMSTLPGLPLAGDPWGCPTKDEMGDYLERYAHDLALPVVVGNGIARLSRGAGGFLARTDAGGRIEAGAVVVATGGFQRPRIPGFAQHLSGRVQQLDAGSYRSPSAVAGQRITVVGDGATGRQVALELARNRSVTLAVGRWRCFGPERMLGRDLTWWAWRTGMLTADKASPMGRLARAVDATPGLHLRSGALRRGGIDLAPRCVGAEGDALVFADGTRRRCDAVVWAMGYRDETAWLDIDHASAGQRFLQDRGISPVPGLYYVGREWQRSRASGLICGVAADARIIARRVRDRLRSRSRAGAGDSG